MYIYFGKNSSTSEQIFAVKEDLLNDDLISALYKKHIFIFSIPLLSLKDSNTNTNTNLKEQRRRSTIESNFKSIKDSIISNYLQTQTSFNKNIFKKNDNNDNDSNNNNDDSKYDYDKYRNSINSIDKSNNTDKINDNDNDNNNDNDNDCLKYHNNQSEHIQEFQNPDDDLLKKRSSRKLSSLFYNKSNNKNIDLNVEEFIYIYNNNDNSNNSNDNNNNYNNKNNNNIIKIHINNDINENINAKKDLEFYENNLNSNSNSNKKEKEKEKEKNYEINEKLISNNENKKTKLGKKYSRDLKNLFGIFRGKSIKNKFKNLLDEFENMYDINEISNIINNTNGLKLEKNLLEKIQFPFFTNFNLLQEFSLESNKNRDKENLGYVNYGKYIKEMKYFFFIWLILLILIEFFILIIN